MTTVAWDGKTMASDSLATDAWGLKEEVFDKILAGNGFLVGTAGEKGGIHRWWKSIEGMKFCEVVEFGYPEFNRDNNDPSIMLVDKWNLMRHVSGVFVEMQRRYHAVGSGRDYALAAMRCGKSASVAIKIAMEFDNNTGGRIITRKLP